MERQLLIIRHGKSSWDQIDLDDIDRPLAPRGLRAAETMAGRIMERGQVPGMVFSSPAKRAYSTARIMSELWGLDQKLLLIQEQIYEAYVSELVEVVGRAPKELEGLAIFGHNPAFTMYANRFLDTPLDNLPTAGVVWLKLESSDWRGLDRRNVLESIVDYPKKAQ